jgi:hypothetical protein
VTVCSVFSYIGLESQYVGICKTPSPSFTNLFCHTTYALQVITSTETERHYDRRIHENKVCHTHVHSTRGGNDRSSEIMENARVRICRCKTVDNSMRRIVYTCTLMNDNNTTQHARMHNNEHICSFYMLQKQARNHSSHQRLLPPHKVKRMKSHMRNLARRSTPSRRLARGTAPYQRYGSQRQLDDVCEVKAQYTAPWKVRSAASSVSVVQAAEEVLRALCLHQTRLWLHLLRTRNGHAQSSAKSKGSAEVCSS